MSRRFVATTALLALLGALSACTSDEDTPLGSEFIDDILGSRPGVVFEDTIPIVSGDTVISFYSLIQNSKTLGLGRDDGYERVIVLKANFSKPGSDTSRTVDEANLRFLVTDPNEGRDIKAVFYRLGTPYTEGDSITALDTLSAIVDPETASPLRTMALATPNYPLPTDLVQGWIRGDSTHNGIGIVFVDLQSDKVIQFGSSESSSSPSIQVNFTDLTSSTYRISDDGNLVRPTEPTTNLILSDGFVRRIYFPIDLSQVDDSAAVHFAEVTFNLVPGTVSGTSQAVELYVPNSADPGDPGFLGGQLVSQVTLSSAATTLEMPVTNVLLAILADKVADNGFVLRFKEENREIKYAEFYTSSNDSLRPRVVLTYSTPAEFEE